mmetsp:Transcript_17520/g.29181  ORF Transcript_17520/g.29181 Transcript_17520/m.29181 type:complete len:88 (+) Transcript_17520:41-304(+)
MDSHHIASYFKFDFPSPVFKLRFQLSTFCIQISFHFQSSQNDAIPDFNFLALFLMAAIPGLLLAITWTASLEVVFVTRPSPFFTIRA